MPLDLRVSPTDLRLEMLVLFVSDMAASRSFYENSLGLRALAVTPHAAAYAAGHVQLCLLPAAEHGVTLRDGPDRSADITFMVDDFPRRHDALAARGVRFSRTLEYDIGVTADFYDPDGHWFSLYRPSEAAMGWPSGRKLEALASGLPRRFPGDFLKDAATPRHDLSDAVIAYVFLLFSDPDVAAGFYGGLLGLDAIEGGPCRRGPTRAEVGVVKYDVGTTMLTTHHVESDGKPRRAVSFGPGSVSIAFRVENLAEAVADLSSRGVGFSGGPAESPIGRLARFSDPEGRVLFLREPAQGSVGSVSAEMSAGPAVAT